MVMLKKLCLFLLAMSMGSAVLAQESAAFFLDPEIMKKSFFKESQRQSLLMNYAAFSERYEAISLALLDWQNPCEADLCDAKGGILSSIAFTFNWDSSTRLAPKPANDLELSYMAEEKGAALAPYLNYEPLYELQRSHQYRLGLSISLSF